MLVRARPRPSESMAKPRSARRKQLRLSFQPGPEPPLNLPYCVPFSPYSPFVNLQPTTDLLKPVKTKTSVTCRQPHDEALSLLWTPRAIVSSRHRFCSQADRKLPDPPNAQAHFGFRIAKFEHCWLLLRRLPNFGPKLQ